MDLFETRHRLPLLVAKVCEVGVRDERHAWASKLSDRRTEFNSVIKKLYGLSRNASRHRPQRWFRGRHDNRRASKPHTGTTDHRQTRDRSHRSGRLRAMTVGVRTAVFGAAA